MAFYFATYSGAQSTTFKTYEFYAFAVANGDVGMVPEPETYALMLAGLAGVGFAAKRRARRARRV